MSQQPVVLPSRDAVARRRRMHRRQAKRRLSRVFTVAVAVFTAASLLRPEVPGFRPDSAAADTLPVVGVPSTARRPGPLALQPLWRPAGDVLKRGAVTGGENALPFRLDDREPARHATLRRWHQIYALSAAFHVKPELARRVYDAAIAEGLEPELGFRLVKVESRFNPRAVSPAGAIGLTQLMLGTAREFDPRVTREQLLKPEINLRIGFRYLRALIRENQGNLHLALLVYNRGPLAVQSDLHRGVSPTNGYESLVTRGYRGRGVLD